MGREVSPIMLFMVFFLVGIPILAWVLMVLGIDRGYISDFISYCASYLGIARSGGATLASELLLIIAFIGGVATAVLYIYERIFSEE
ncbi:MAG: hypothetical protein RQ885_12585 [Desulfurococcales archaeon]|jgi:hypothetical protein|nr:hypothetical protein [Desulfurococcales archaeon]